jgi:hypothetical protein
MVKGQKTYLIWPGPVLGWPKCIHDTEGTDTAPKSDESCVWWAWIPTSGCHTSYCQFSKESIANFYG